jgi:hypothetical protein
MNQKTVSLRSRVFAAGLVAGLAAGWPAGCSRSGSARVNVQRVRAALAKRKSDYGESAGTQPPARDKSPVKGR